MPTAAAVQGVPGWIEGMLIALAAFLVYLPALHGGWIWDDHLDLPQNPLLREAGGLWKIWTEPTQLYDFYPLKASVQWLQWQLWHEQPLGYHLTNLALHVVSALLFTQILKKLGVGFAFLGGLLFAVHPLAVESVAWICELKNALALPPLLLAFAAFIAFARSGRRSQLLLAWVWFGVTLLCKTSAILFPVFLLAYLVWERRRLSRRDVLATLPFFALSLALGVVTLWFQEHRAIADEPIAVGDILTRLGLSGHALGFYVMKCVWPAGLNPIYPRWSLAPFSIVTLLPWLALAALVVVSWRRRDTWGRHVLLGTTWVVLALLPFLGFITISYFQHTWVMDHLAYLALLGVVGLVTAGVSAWCSAPLRWALALTLGVSLAWSAHQQARRFADEETFWRTTLERNPNAWLASYSLGVRARDAGHIDDALAYFRATLQTNPNELSTLINLGALELSAGQPEAGEAHLQRALQLKPDSVLAWRNLGDVQRATGRPALALASYERAFALAPRDPELLNGLGVTLCDLGRIGEAARRFREALAVDAHSAEAHSNLANVLWQAGLSDEALAHYRQAAALKPDTAEIHANLGNVYQALGRHAEAISAYDRALMLAPQLPGLSERREISRRALAIGPR